MVQLAQHILCELHSFNSPEYSLVHNFTKYITSPKLGFKHMITWTTDHVNHGSRDSHLVILCWWRHGVKYVRMVQIKKRQNSFYKMLMWDSLLKWQITIDKLENTFEILFFFFEWNERFSLLEVGLGTFLNPSLDVRTIHDTLDQSQQFLVGSKVLFSVMLQWGAEEIGHLDVSPSDLK